MSSENQVAEQEQQTVASEQPATETQEVNWKDSLPDDLKNEKALEYSRYSRFSKVIHTCTKTCRF